jgi:hypothetical protein
VYRKYSASEFASLQGGDGFLGRQLSVKFPSSNPYGFADVKAYKGELPSGMVAYNQLTRVPREGRTAVHFFLSDNKFETVWSRPAVALTRLLEVGMALGPDFSLFCDWPLVVQQYNWYRNCWCMALWQAEGLDVIPSICWSDPTSYEWCFLGLPRRATVAVSSVGTYKYPETREAFLHGFAAMRERLQPRRIVFYGRVPESLRKLSILQVYPSKWDEYYHGKGIM